MALIEEINIAPEIQQIIPSDVAWHYHVVPFAVSENTVDFYVEVGSQ